MATNALPKLTSEALALPKLERLRLAQSLWESIEDEDLPGVTEAELAVELRDRLQDEPDANWKTHEEVMLEARRQFGCRK